jgi:hypothetical protein
MTPSKKLIAAVAVVGSVVVSGCADAPELPTSPESPSGGASLPARVQPQWGPETPHAHLQIVLRGDGFGLVKFRQPNDADLVVLLETWIRDLSPHTSYYLERAVDVNLDGNCTSAAWLTLGKGPQPYPITTDEKGTGREELFRSVAAFPVGSQFDIHFRLVHGETSAVVLTSGCYQFTISQ